MHVPLCGAHPIDMYQGVHNEQGGATAVGKRGPGFVRPAGASPAFLIIAPDFAALSCAG